MDFQDKGSAWIVKLGEKIDTIYSEIDVISKDTLEYAENKLLTAKENVKQFCSEFMQEMLPDFMKETPSDRQGTEELDLPTSELLENDADEGHNVVPSNSTPLNHLPPETARYSETDPSVDQESSDGNEMGLDEYLLKVMPFPSITADIEASEKDASGMTSVVSGVNHDTEFEGQIKLGHPESVACQYASSTSSAKAGGTSSAVGAKLDSSSILGSSIVSTVSDNGKFLEIRDPASGDELSGTSDKNKSEQRNDTRASAMGMDIESFNILTIDGSCILVDGNKLCSSCNFQAEYGTSQLAGSGVDASESLHASETTTIDLDLEEPDWEII